LAIKPGLHIAIRNPGAFRRRLLIESLEQDVPLRRILPEAKPRNPKLADVLRVFRKWEGRGIGMATMVNLCLQNEIDLPYYRFGTDEVTLYVCTGRLLDDRMLRLFAAFDDYIGKKMHGGVLNRNQLLVLAYLIKSEWANSQIRYTILLSPDNNHFSELAALETCGLITKHSASTGMYPVYIVDRTLITKNYLPELRQQFGLKFDGLDDLHKQVLSIVYRHNHFSKKKLVSAKVASFSLWYERGEAGDIEKFDAFYRKVRRVFNHLEKDGFVVQQHGTRGYLLNPNGGVDSLPSGSN
jgi:ATP-dependent DNA helicase RecG